MYLGYILMIIGFISTISSIMGVIFPIYRANTVDKEGENDPIDEASIGEGGHHNH